MRTAVGGLELVVTRLSDDVAVRSLDPSDPIEARLQDAARIARRRSGARLAAAIEGVDLEALSADRHDPALGRGRLTSAGWHRLDPLTSLDEHLGVQHLGNDLVDPSASRLTHTAHGVDVQRPPSPAMLHVPLHPTAPTRADVAGLADAVLSGGSVVILGLDEAVPRVDAFVEDLEAVSGTRSAALVYLGGPDARGWGPHYDNHDVVVCQASGTKRWRVFAPVERWPLRPHSPYRTSGDLVWDGVLGPGDVLVVPRGWGHEVLGDGQPSIHLTFPISATKAGDLLHLAARRSVDVADLRADVARGGPAPTDAVEQLLGPTTAADGLAWWRARMPARSRPAFAAHARALDALDRGSDPGVALRISAPGGISVVLAPGRRGRAFALAGHEVTCGEAEAAALASLIAGPASLAALADVAPEPHRLAAVLLRSGLVALDAADPTPRSSTTSASSWTGATRSAATPSRPGPDGAPPIVVGEDPFPTSRIRRLRHGAGWEGALAAATEAGHETAVTTLAADVSGLSLGDLLGATRDRAPAFGTLSSDASARIDARVGIDAVLSRHDLGPQRVRLAAGRDLEHRPAPEALFRAAFSAHSPTPLAAGPVGDVLAGGTTLVVLGVDLAIPGLSRWLRLLEHVGRRSATANVYASRGDAPGFGAHWDDHDLLVVQVEGSKTWDLWEPAATDPVRPHTPLAVSDRWHGRHTLREGDVLFLPRGWGHAVTGHPDRSVHLTITLRAARADLALQRMLSRSAEVEDARLDVARLDGRHVATSPQRYASGAGDAVEDVLAFWWERVPARVHHRYADALALLAGDRRGLAVELAAPISAVLARQPADRHVVLAGGRAVSFAPTALPLLERLASCDRIPVTELHGRGEPDAVDDALRALVLGGLLEVSAAGSGP
ncbi:MAG TPA: cupin domain-containing protein [Aquihabitans sp.]|jgi:ribosomal protein L16 Arg81 hydroxylase|nr:cupin domain-containing protein [Aquihabitans sp.]